MKIEYTTRRDGNKCLILFFAGWSTRCDLYIHLSRDGWDTAIVSEYSNLSFDKSFLGNYDTVYVYAWSLGIIAAATVLNDEDFTAAFAINGTELPVNDQYGIPADIYNATCSNLSQNNLRKFRARIAGGNRNFLTSPLVNYTDDDIPSLQLELQTIAKASLTPRHITWNRAYISDNDLIFPPESQQRYWEKRAIPTNRISYPHLPDFQYIIASTIPNITKVGLNFHKALETYDNAATAQETIARHLTDLLSAQEIITHPTVLEIGQGSGLFSRMYAPEINPASIDYVDLYPTGVFNLAPQEQCHVANAEEWIAAAEDDSFDAIVSASCIQWFVNTSRFFSNAARTLRKGGILAISSFLPGNLRQLDAIRPTPLSYPSASRLQKELENFFSNVEIATETIQLKFSTAREAIVHLKNTGLKAPAGHSGTRRLIEAIKNPLTGEYELTYEAFYAIVRNC